MLFNTLLYIHYGRNPLYYCSLDQILGHSYFSLLYHMPAEVEILGGLRTSYLEQTDGIALKLDVISSVLVRCIVNRIYTENCLLLVVETLECGVEAPVVDNSISLARVSSRCSVFLPVMYYRLR
jgi:hypothetical protein